MIGWARARRREWRAHSRHRQVEATLWWTATTFPAVVYLSCMIGVPRMLTERSDGASFPLMTVLVLVLGLVSCVLGMSTVKQAVGEYLGTGRASRPRLGVLAGLLVAQIALIVVLAATSAVPKQAPTLLLLAAVAPFLCVYALLLPVRTVLLSHLALVGLVCAALAAAGTPAKSLLGSTVALTVLGPSVVVSSRCSAWYLTVLRELDKARGTQARLAVAEERLRFGRDLHDVMGRNLSVIALKSELAVRLAQRADPAAADQMVEVQRIARDSQREIREVVRGYRSADLRTELAGARGILRAAGIDCRVDAPADSLPEPVRSALGWVVREGTTNVLRHADAARCTVTVRTTGGGTGPAGRSATATATVAVLTMENDGAPPTTLGPGGAGLPGLRERLAAIGGTLTTEQPDAGTFRLTAEVPLPPDDAADDAAPPDQAMADHAPPDAPRQLDTDVRKTASARAGAGQPEEER